MPLSPPFLPFCHRLCPSPLTFHRASFAPPQREQLHRILAYADETALSFFHAQGFTHTLSLRRSAHEGRIHDFDGAVRDRRAARARRSDPLTRRSVLAPCSAPQQRPTAAVHTTCVLCRC